MAVFTMRYTTWTDIRAIEVRLFDVIQGYGTVVNVAARGHPLVLLEIETEKDGGRARWRMNAGAVLRVRLPRGGKRWL